MKKWIRKLLICVFFTLIATVTNFWQPDLQKSDLERKYTTSTSQFLEVEGDRIHVRDTGQKNGMAIVLIHGFGASLHTWEDWSMELDKEYRVIRFDLPGFGLSGPDTIGDYSDERTNRILLGLLNQLHVDQVALVGNSIGGRMAWYFTAKHPERVAKLVLISPDGFASPGMVYNKAPHVPAYLQIIQYVFPAFLFRQNLAFAYNDQAVLTPALFARYFELALYPGNRQAMLDRMRQTVLQEPSQYLHAIHVPVLLLWGENDRMIPIQNAQDYLSPIPQARLQRIPHMGHLPQEEDPGRSLPYIRDFLHQ